MLRKRTAFWLVGILIVSLVTLSACGGNPPATDEGDTGASPPQQTEQPGEAKTAQDTLVIASGTYPGNLDPVVEYDMLNSNVVRNVYDRLVEYEVVEKDGQLVGTENIVPSLAKNWDISDDGLTYTFHLVENAKFHDGSPVNAEAVKYSFERAMKMGQGPSWILSQAIAPNGLRVIDEYTIECTLKAPFGAFIPSLSHDVACIVNPAVVEAHGGVEEGKINEWMAKGDAGSGPFYLDNAVTDESLTITRFDDYWREPAKLKQIIWQVVKEQSNRQLFLKNGEVDIATSIDLKDMEALGQDPNVEVRQEAAVNIEFMPLNQKHKPFDDIRVRKAVNYAINKQNLLDYVQYGYARQLKSPLPEGMPGHDGSFWEYEYDPDRAQSLLEEAGLADGFQTSLVISSDDPQLKRAATMVQSDLKDLGITVDIQTLATPTLREMRNNGELPLTFLGWLPDYNDPDAFVNLLASWNIGSGGNNWAWYENPMVDSLITEGKAESDPEARDEIYRELQKTVVDDAPWVFLYQWDNVVPLRKEVKDFVAYPLQWIYEFRLTHK